MLGFLDYIIHAGPSGCLYVPDISSPSLCYTPCICLTISHWGNFCHVQVRTQSLEQTDLDQNLDPLLIAGVTLYNTFLTLSLFL